MKRLVTSLVVILAVVLAAVLLAAVGRRAFRDPDAAAEADRHIVAEKMARLEATRLARVADSLRDATELAEARFDSLDHARRAEAERAAHRLQLWRDSATALIARLDGQGVPVLRDSNGTPFIPLDTAAKMLADQQQSADATVRACRLTVTNCRARGDSLELGLQKALHASAAADSARDADRRAFRRERARSTLTAGTVGAAVGAFLTLLLR